MSGMKHSGSDVTLRLAGDPEAALLLTLMEPFNAFEQTPWDPVAKQRALEKLLRDRSLGVVGLLEADRRPIGYFVVTWGYDLEWDGRDAFLTEMFLLPEARGRGWGGQAMAHVESVAREHGARALHLMVRDENFVAQAPLRARRVREPASHLSHEGAEERVTVVRSRTGVGSLRSAPAFTADAGHG